jgi:hypothetical protein
MRVSSLSVFSGRRKGLEAAYLICSALASGCGNLIPSPYNLPPPGIIEPLHLAGAHTPLNPSLPPFNCPYEPNILPRDPYGRGSNVAYTACPASNLVITNRIIIHGKTLFSNQVCIFPAQDYGNGSILWKKDFTQFNSVTRQNLSWVTCPQIGTKSTGLIVDVPLIRNDRTFNAIAVVEVQFQAAFQYCTQIGIENCPSEVQYYYGIFR